MQSLLFGRAVGAAAVARTMHAHTTASCEAKTPCVQAAQAVQAALHEGTGCREWVGRARPGGRRGRWRKTLQRGAGRPAKPTNGRGCSLFFCARGLLLLRVSSLDQPRPSVNGSLLLENSLARAYLASPRLAGSRRRESLCSLAAPRGRRAFLFTRTVYCFNIFSTPAAFVNSMRAFNCTRSRGRCSSSRIPINFFFR